MNSTLHGTLGKNFFQKVTPKHVQIASGHFWGRFWAFSRFLKFFDFSEFFRRLDPPWNSEQKNFFEKTTPKHVQNKFGHFWERFWTFLEF